MTLCPGCQHPQKATITGGHDEAGCDEFNEYTARYCPCTLSPIEIDRVLDARRKNEE